MELEHHQCPEWSLSGEAAAISADAFDGEKAERVTALGLRHGVEMHHATSFLLRPVSGVSDVSECPIAGTEDSTEDSEDSPLMETGIFGIFAESSLGSSDRIHTHGDA